LTEEKQKENGCVRPRKRLSSQNSTIGARIVLNAERIITVHNIRVDLDLDPSQHTFLFPPSMALRLLSKVTPAAARPQALRKTTSIAARRHASLYNTDIAGLTEEQAEVRPKLPTCRFHPSSLTSTLVE
jgi:hypothetical protein